MPVDANVIVGVKEAGDRRVTVNSNLAMVVEILLDLAHAHNHPACAEIGLATQEVQAGQQHCAETAPAE